MKEDEKVFDVIIIGSGPAGMNAALYAARGSLNVLVLDKEGYGGALNDTDKIENYLGLNGTTGEELSEQMYEQVMEYENVTHEFAEVKEVLKEEDGVFKVVGDEEDYKGLSIIIATGVKHNKLGLENEELFENKGISQCALCDSYFYKGKDVAVVGGGNSALEEALYLSDVVNHVTLIHRRDAFRGDKIAQERVFKKENISIIWDTEIKGLNGADKLESLTLETKLKDEKVLSDFKLDGLFEYVGVVPTSDVFKPFNILDTEGYVISNNDMETSVKGIYAIGDIRASSKRQIATAIGDGAIAGLSVRNYVESLKD